MLSTLASNAATSNPTSSDGIDAAAPADPRLVLGSDSCVKCHASEVKSQLATPHVLTFDELHRKPEAASIASKLGLQSIKHEGRCVACHYTQQVEPATGNVHAIAGVSCESCHGGARNWLDIHHDYGGESITRLTESQQHRQQRLERSIAAGMRNPEDVFLVAQSCYRCHTTADEELVNVGGHSVGSLDFEFVAWSQGTQRHNFVRSDGQSNQVSSPERLRVMFVAGMMAELEATLRATSVATEKAKYGVNAAQRAARAAARLTSVSQKVAIPEVAEAIRVFETVALKLNNRDELTAAADAIARLGLDFARNHDGSALSVLDPFIPEPSRWK
jgi:Cytochrome c554 and c-prime